MTRLKWQCLIDDYPPPSLLNLNVCVTSKEQPCLWLGRLGGREDHHSDLLLVRGFLKYCPPRGSCEVRGAGPNLWFAAAGSLGFRVKTVRCGYTPFMDLIGPFCRSPQVLSPMATRCNMLPDIVFFDLASLLWGPGADKYWQHWRTTHVFFCLGTDDNAASPLGWSSAPQCPPGWSTRLLPLSHCEAGGATSGRWTLVAWYPPLVTFSEPLPVVAQSWFPLFCYVKDREMCLPHPTPPSGGLAVPSVAHKGGLVQDWGLFPALDVGARVLVQCSSSPSGYRLQGLTWSELGSLWDLPISVMDAMPQGVAEAMLPAFCKTAPTKDLIAGADYLLNCFGGVQRGFWAKQCQIWALGRGTIWISASASLLLLAPPHHRCWK